MDVLEEEVVVAEGVILLLVGFSYCCDCRL